MSLGAERDQIVVVEGDAVRAEVGEAVYRFHGVQGAAGGVTEGVTALPADGPQAEAELVPGHGLTAHRDSLDHFVKVLYKLCRGQTNMRQHTGEPPGPRPWTTGRRGRVHDGRTGSGTAGRRGGQLHTVHQGAGRGRGDRCGHRPGPGAAHGQRRRRQGERPTAVVAGTGRGAGTVRRCGAAGLGGVRRRAAARAGHPGRGRCTGASGHAVERRPAGAPERAPDRGAGRRGGLGGPGRERAGPGVHRGQVGLAEGERAGRGRRHRRGTAPARLPHRAAHRRGRHRSRRCVRDRLVGVVHRVL